MSNYTAAERAGRAHGTMAKTTLARSCRRLEDRRRYTGAYTREEVRIPRIYSTATGSPQTRRSCYATFASLLIIHDDIDRFRLPRVITILSLSLSLYLEDSLFFLFPFFLRFFSSIPFARCTVAGLNFDGSRSARSDEWDVKAHPSPFNFSYVIIV